MRGRVNIRHHCSSSITMDWQIEDLNASVPLGRIAEPEDIADVVTFLASDQARYLCGSLIEANGGKPVR